MVKQDVTFCHFNLTFQVIPSHSKSFVAFFWVLYQELILWLQEWTVPWAGLGPYQFIIVATKSANLSLFTWKPVLAAAYALLLWSILTVWPAQVVYYTTQHILHFNQIHRFLDGCLWVGWVRRKLYILHKSTQFWCCWVEVRLRLNHTLGGA